MAQLKPKEQFYISRHLEDPQDSNTYYVKAFVYDKKDITNTIDTVELTDIGTGAGDNRFAKVWEVPSDPSGEGLWIVIVTKFYTDSGYTSLSLLQRIEEREYLVQERVSTAHMGGGGDVDYKKVRSIVKEEVEKLPKPIAPKEVNLTPVLNAIANIPEPTDLSPVLKAVQSLPEAPRLDLSPVISKIDRIPTIDYNVLLKATKEVITTVEKAIRASSSQKEIDSLNKELNKMRKALTIPVKFEMSRLKEEKQEEEQEEGSIRKYFKNRYK